MAIWLAVLLGLALSYAGMAALCLGMDRHYLQVWKRKANPATRRALRMAGWLLLTLGVLPCVWAWGAGVGLVIWLGFVSVGALAQALLLAYRPRGSMTLGLFCAVVALATLAIDAS